MKPRHFWALYRAERDEREKVETKHGARHGKLSRSEVLAIKRMLEEDD